MRAQLTLTLPDPAATDALAHSLARNVAAGDAILLSGPTGAGKSHLARAMIHALQAAAGLPPEDVPSPTYTLVQTYEAGDLSIWHADLYRLGDSSELEELGLTAAWEDALTLIEWPDRLGDAAPQNALRIDLALAETGRVVTFRANGDRLRRIIEGALQIAH